MRRALAALLLCLAAVRSGAEGPQAGGGPGGGPPAGGLPAGFRLVDASAANVNGEVIFRSDVEREACFRRCDAYPGLSGAEPSLAAARDRLVSDTLVLQEQRKLGLGDVDNAALAATTGEVRKALEACADPCARKVADDGIREFARRRLLVQDFLRKRIFIFIDVTDEDVRREVEARRARPGGAVLDIREEDVRRELVEERGRQEVRNWMSRTTSKSRIFLSPMEEK